ncbi:hypothetical protein CsatA_004844 [Cannabis sativa]
MVAGWLLRGCAMVASDEGFNQTMVAWWLLGGWPNVASDEGFNQMKVSGWLGEGCIKRRFQSDEITISKMFRQL